jgi:hypothetical protein
MFGLDATAQGNNQKSVRDRENKMVIRPRGGHSDCDSSERLSLLRSSFHVRKVGLQGPEGDNSYESTLVMTASESNVSAGKVHLVLPLLTIGPPNTAWSQIVNSH